MISRFSLEKLFGTRWEVCPAANFAAFHGVMSAASAVCSLLLLHARSAAAGVVASRKMLLLPQKIMTRRRRTATKIVGTYSCRSSCRPVRVPG